MRTFSDAAGRQWRLSMTLGTVIAVRDALSVDLLQPEAGDPPLLARLASDDILLAEIAMVMVADQIAASHVAPDEVRRALDGSAMDGIAKAFWAEAVDFFRARRRLDRAAAIEKQIETMTAAIEAARLRIEAVSVEAALISGETSG